MFRHLALQHTSSHTAINELKDRNEDGTADRNKLIMFPIGEYILFR